MTGRSKFALFIFILFFTITLPVFAAEPSFRLAIDSTSLEKGVSSKLRLIVENASGAEVVEIQGLENFQVINQGRSTSTSIVNGAISRSETYSYVILPREAGEFSLKGIVRYRGKTYETNQLQVTVRERSSLGESGLADIFIKTVVGRTEVFFGEKIPLSYELYTRYNIEGYGFLEEPDLSAFLVQETGWDSSRGNYLELGGRSYLRYNVREVILTPVTTGTHEIPAVNFQVNVSTGGFFSSSRPVYLQTEPVGIVVKPLPREGQPANFTGLVGQLAIESSYDKTELNYGEPLVLKVRLSGSCNLDTLERIITEELPGLSVYETVTKREEGVVNGQYQASREFEIIIVPDSPGELEIPELTIPYFNPETEGYESVRIPAATIQVRGEMPVFSTNQKAAERPEPIVRETIRIEQVNYALADDGYLLIRFKKDNLTTILYIFLSLLLLSLVIVIIYKYWKSRDNRLRELYREARKERDEERLFAILNEMLKYRYGFSLKAIPRERLEVKIADKELLRELLEVLVYFEEKALNRNRQQELDLREKVKNIYNLLKHENI